MNTSHSKFQYNSLHQYFTEIWTDKENTVSDSVNIPLKKNEDCFPLENFPVYTIIACLIYLYRINFYENFSFWLCNKIDRKLSNKLLLTTPLSPNQTISKITDFLMNSLSLIWTTKKQSCIHDFGSAHKLDHVNIYFLIIKSEAQFDKERILKPNDIIFAVCLKQRELIIFSQGKVRKALMKNLKCHISNIFSAVVHRSKIKISKFDFMSEQEKSSIMDVWNNTHFRLPSLDIPGLFEGNCQKSPHKTAVTFGNESLTYKELNDRSDRLANHLQSVGIKSGMFICILINRSFQMIVSIIAILKLGAIYIPIDSQYPLKRIKYIVQNSESKYIISTEEFLKLINKIDCAFDVIFLDRIEKSLIHRSPSHTTQGNNKKLAYLIYTSGSTGKPKGVMISHRNVINYAYWFGKKFQFNDKSSIDFSSSIGFDLAVACTLVPLVLGATISICDDETKIDPSQYLNYLLARNITHIECIPDYFNHLLFYPELIKKLKRLKWILLGGDALVKKDLERWFLLNKLQKIVNEYGPTECTVAITSYLINKKSIGHMHTIPIGTPAHNTHTFILDRYKNICPVGVTGELFIGGESVSPGYLDKDKNLGKFISRRLLTSNFRRFYNTGDLARWLPCGNIIFLGRSDEQVKINGFRIELSEIESQLLEHRDVIQCKVIAKKNLRGEKFITAYVVLDSESINCNFLKEYLKTYLPKYMIPSQIFSVKDFPLNASGKIDIKALSSIECSKSQLNIKSLDKKTLQVIQIWEKLLGHKNFSLNDSFLDIGGGSLLTVALMLEIEKEFGVRLPLSRLSVKPTILSLLELIKELKCHQLHQIFCNALNPKIICLKENGECAESFFLIPPVGGTVFIFKSLVKNLEWNGRIFALQDPAIEDAKIKFSSLESMGSYYVAAIKKIQPKGPYLVAGASFGATLAVEIVNQFLRQGDAVKFLGLFDGWAEYSNDLKDVQYFSNFMNKEVSRLNSNYGESLIRIQYEREQLLFSYKIPKINIDLTLFKATTLWPIFESMNTPKNCWEKFIDSPIHVYHVDGDHESMFYEPHIRKLAQLLTTCLTSNC
jgi:amino acid adenylation domain-containing protein